MPPKRSQNATSHGAYAQGLVVMPWESPADFAALLDSVRQDLNPVGPLQEQFVLDIATAMWRKRRLAIGFLLPFFKTKPAPALLKAAAGGIAALADYLANEGAGQGTITATGSQMLDYLKAARAGEKNPEARLPPSVPGRSYVELAYDPAAIERVLKIEAMLDNSVTKALSRLVGLKEYNRLYGGTPVEALPPAKSPRLAPADEPPPAKSEPALEVPNPTESPAPLQEPTAEPTDAAASIAKGEATKSGAKERQRR
jgi:hypothetical protein